MIYLNLITSFKEGSTLREKDNKMNLVQSKRRRKRNKRKQRNSCQLLPDLNKVSSALLV